MAKDLMPVHNAEIVEIDENQAGGNDSGIQDLSNGHKERGDKAGTFFVLTGVFTDADLEKLKATLEEIKSRNFFRATVLGPDRMDDFYKVAHAMSWLIGDPSAPTAPRRRRSSQ
jgi:hypothetical protein